MSRPRRSLAALAMVLAIATSGGCGRGGNDSGSGGKDGSQATSTTAATALSTTSHVSYVAEATGGDVDVYDGATSGEPTRSLANPTENGGPLVFLAVDDVLPGDERFEVFLPVRPNGSTGWIEPDQVRVTQHNYWIEVFTGAHRIVVHEGDDVVFEGPVALGTTDTPTPGGVFYLKELLQPPDPNTVYGPYAYGLSGFSNVLDQFNGGEGVIGIHGNNDETVLGQDVSHGCIRMSNEGITFLAGVLPLGTPVSILA